MTSTPSTQRAEERARSVRVTSADGPAPLVREPVEIERRNVSKARRQKIIAAQGGVCKRADCDAPAVEVDHIVPLWLGGSNRDENLEGLCGPCHLRKTRAEAPLRAKIMRQSGETGQYARRQKRGGSMIPAHKDGLKSRGFDKTKTRKFNGQTVSRNP